MRRAAGASGRPLELLHLQFLSEWSVLRRIADEDDEFSGVNLPAILILAPIGERAAVEDDVDMMRVAGAQANLFESLEFFDGAPDLSGRIAHVDLGNGSSFKLAGVADVEGDGTAGVRAGLLR